MASQKRIIAALMQRHGRTFASELGIDLRKNTPSPLFRLLCYSLLTSAPISAELAMRGARAMAKAGCEATRPIYVGRPEAASPATGNGQRHLRELQTFLDQAITMDRPAMANQDAAE